MVLISGDDIAAPFAQSRRHAGMVPAWNGKSNALPHTCPSSNADTASQSANQHHGEVAK